MVEQASSNDSGSPRLDIVHRQFTIDRGGCVEVVFVHVLILPRL